MSMKKSKTQVSYLTAEKCRGIDRYAIEKLGIPGIVLMENAGRLAADRIERWLTTTRTVDRRHPRTVIICGKGNNGGDGFVIARHLVNRGHEVEIDLYGDPATLADDAAINYTIAQRMKIPIHPLGGTGRIKAAARRWQSCRILVDALLGTGFAGEVREPLSTIIHQINNLKGPLVVAVDVPSGLHADTGKPGGVAVRAQHTVTFSGMKKGFLHQAARTYTGRITVADIGAPTEMIIQRLHRRSLPTKPGDRA